VIYTEWWYKKAGKLWRCACSLFELSEVFVQGEGFENSKNRVSFRNVSRTISCKVIYRVILWKIAINEKNVPEETYTRYASQIKQGFPSLRGCHYQTRSRSLKYKRTSPGKSQCKVTNFTGPIYEQFFFFFYFTSSFRCFQCCTFTFDILYQTDVSNPTYSWVNGLQSVAFFRFQDGIAHHFVFFCARKVSKSAAFRNFFRHNFHSPPKIHFKTGWLPLRVLEKRQNIQILNLQLTE